MDYMSPCLRHKHGKLRAAGVPAYVAGALQSRGSGELAGISNLVLKFAFQMILSHFQKLPEPPEVHASAAERGLQAPLPPSQAAQARQTLQASLSSPQAPHLC